MERWAEVKSMAPLQTASAIIVNLRDEQKIENVWEKVIAVKNAP